MLPETHRFLMLLWWHHIAVLQSHSICHWAHVLNGLTTGPEKLPPPPHTVWIIFSSTLLVCIQKSQKKKKPGGAHATCTDRRTTTAKEIWQLTCHQVLHAQSAKRMLLCSRHVDIQKGSSANVQWLAGNKLTTGWLSVEIGEAAVFWTAGSKGKLMHDDR